MYGIKIHTKGMPGYLDYWLHEHTQDDPDMYLYDTVKAAQVMADVINKYTEKEINAYVDVVSSETLQEDAERFLVR